MRRKGVIRPRWRKVIRDLWQDRARTSLTVVAIAVGTFGFGTVTGAYSILTRELRREYLASNPASATLWTDPFDQSFVEAVADMPAIAAAEGRRSVVGRVEVEPGRWTNILLFAVDDFDSVGVDVFEPEEGTWPPGDREILVERDALPNTGAAPGDTLSIKTPNGSRRELLIAGTVHDVGQEPAQPNGLVYGYVTLDALEWLGEPPLSDELRIVVAENAFDEEHIARVVGELEEWVEQDGHPIYRIEIPPPGEHPFSDIMSALLFVQAAFGLLTLALGGLLVVNMTSALLARQVRQVGMMKAIGASRGQVLVLYLALVTVLGGLALAAAIPASTWAAGAYAALAGDLLNFDIDDDAIAPAVLILELAASLLTPLVGATFPVIAGTRVTVREAIGDYGVTQSRADPDGLQAVLGRLRGIGRPLLLSIRNAFRKRGRLALTLGTLAVGGGVFVAAVSVRASMIRTVDDAFSYRPYDIDVCFARPYRIEHLETTVGAVPGVARLEAWGWTEATRVHPDGAESDPFSIKAPPAATALMIPKLIEGRWLLPDDENALVVNHTWADEQPDVAAGDEVVLEIDGRESAWIVVGVVREVMAAPTAYANYTHYARAVREMGTAGSVVVVTGESSAAFHKTTARALEQALEETNTDVLRLETMTEARRIVVDHFSIITSILLVTSILAAVVGGLGLMTTMSTSVLERTREISVMRAIGASTQAVLHVIVGEGVFIGLMSGCFAAVLALPVGMSISALLGMILMQTPFSFVYSQLGLGMWMAIVVVFTAGAGFVPAWRAARMSVRQGLAYE